MKKIINTILSIGFIGTLSLNANNIIEAKKVENLGEIKPASSAWLSAKPTKVILYPQRILQTESIDTNGSNEINATSKAKKITLKALYDEKNIAFLMIWGDSTKNIQQKDQNISYSDGFSIHFTQITEVKKLPYIGIGNKGRSVITYSQKARNVKKEEKDLKKPNTVDTNQYQKIFISEGFKSIQQIKDENITSTANMEYANNGWKGTLMRPFKDKYLDLNQSSIPVAFAIWNGEKEEKGDIKLISSWIGVNLESKKSNPLLYRLSKKIKGNVEKGKKLYNNNCTACHRTNDSQTAPINKAPNLSNIGGYSTIDYLIESIIDPSAIITSKENYPDDTNSTWYKIDDNGTKLSIMPSFEYMDKPSLVNIVTYLKTLKAELEK